MHYFTGDRKKETEALFDSTKERFGVDEKVPPVGRAPATTPEVVRTAAEKAVREAHGDPGVGATEPPGHDIATPADVETKVAKDAVEKEMVEKEAVD